MCVQTFLLEATIEGLDLGVIRRFARSREVQFDPMIVGPLVHCLRDEFAAVVDLDRLGRPAGHTKLFKHTHNIRTLQALAGINRQAFAGVVINDGQGPQSATIEQGVCHEIHAPDVVDPCGLGLGLPQVGCLVPLWPTMTQ